MIVRRAQRGRLRANLSSRYRCVTATAAPDTTKAPHPTVSRGFGAFTVAVTVGFEPTDTSQDAIFRWNSGCHAADSPVSSDPRSRQGLPDVGRQPPRHVYERWPFVHRCGDTQTHLATHSFASPRSPARATAPCPGLSWRRNPTRCAVNGMFSTRNDSLRLEHNRLTDSVSERRLQLRRSLETTGKTRENRSQWVVANCA